jgi:hypothetical protein
VGTWGLVVVTVHLSRRRSLVVAWTRRAGLHAAVWRASCGDLPDSEDGDDGLGGVREPRSPHPPSRRGTVALAIDPHPD